MARLEDDMDTQFANDKHRMMANIVFTSAFIKNRFQDFIKPYNLSSPQFNVLRILRGAKDWLNMNEVKTRMVEKSPNATRLCDKLVDKGWVERRRSDTDRRLVYLKISKSGLKLLKDIDINDDGAYMKFMDNVNMKEAKVINEILDKLRG